MYQSPMPDIESIINTYGRMVTSICARMIQNEEQVKDAVQDVWLEITKSLTGFRGDSKLSTWIYSITKRVALKNAKKEKMYNISFLKEYYSGEALELPYEDDVDKRLWVKEMCDKCLTGTLRCLDYDTRLIYVFRDVAQLSYSEIADVMEMSQEAVRQSISKTRRKLRNFLNNQCILSNPNAACRCRMHSWVKEIQLEQEYHKLSAAVHKINIYKASEMILPKKNYWKI